MPGLVGDKLRMNARDGLFVIYVLAAIFAITGGIAWFKFDLRRSARAAAGKPADLQGISTAITLTALSMILAGGGFLLSAFL